MKQKLETTAFFGIQDFGTVLQIALSRLCISAKPRKAKGHRLKKSGTPPEEKINSELNTRCKYELQPLGANVGNI